MIGFNHVISGVIIGSIAPLPAVPVIALASHFVMDTLPHFGKSEVFKPYNKNFKLLLIFDALMCFIILGFGLCLIPDKKLAIIAGKIFLVCKENSMGRNARWMDIRTNLFFFNGSSIRSNNLSIK